MGFFGKIFGSNKSATSTVVTQQTDSNSDMNSNIMKELGLDILPAEKQAEVFERISKIIFQAVLLRALDSMTEKMKDDLDEYLQANENDGSAILTYLASNVPGYNAIVNEETLKFKRESLDLLGQIR